MQKPAVGGPFSHPSGYWHEGLTAWLAMQYWIAPVSGPNSLLTGNFTGNFANFGPQDLYTLQEAPVPQPSLSQSLHKITGKKFARAGNFF